ncbi:hypothetical protein SAMN05421743_101317 [Thalassobacillus cyri]|uniref:Uncharacterized protein n=1 Tax=Thalassobacillus cyri TaxID=571932 RepID=A0A1H3W4E1_9BACI|nr:hypothetical protein [Thalassobacillus cyri]SDZ81985.1 hypothetical protein SAMN05421743_101317 [Thalassobacillus cyri]
MTKKKAGILLGVTSILPVIISVIVFYILRGPDVDLHFIITVYSVLSVAGILLAILSWFMAKRWLLLLIGLVGNGFVLVFAYFLQLAMGISEP